MNSEPNAEAGATGAGVEAETPSEQAKKPESRSPRKELLLAGKDYFTEAEAAAYCCVSHSQFQAKHEEYGIHAFWFMGKKLYRRVDLQQALEREWMKSPMAMAIGYPSNPRRRRLSGPGR